MIFANEYGSVDFWKEVNIPNFKKVAVTLSAGTDSALVLYMLCTYITENNLDIEILPFTGVDTKRPMNHLNASEIVDFFQEKFPNITFLSHFIFWYEHTPRDSEMKREAHRKEERKLYNEEDVKLFCRGKSANPPEDEAQKHNMFFDRERERDSDIDDGYKIFMRTGREGKSGSEPGRWIYTPLAFVDKRFVAKCYKDYDLMEELFPITASCIGYEKTTDYWTKPCKKCWWCKEKLWAFGMYDGGL